MASSEIDEFERLLFDWEDGTLNAAGITRLRKLLHVNSDVRKAYVKRQFFGAIIRLDGDAGISSLAINEGEEDAVLCPLKPGEASLHHGWTIHASNPNTSDDRRIGLNIQYINPRMRQKKADSDSAMLIRGQDRYSHYETDQPATEWLPQDAATRLQALTQKYHAISGRPNDS